MPYPRVFPIAMVRAPWMQSVMGCRVSQVAPLPASVPFEQGACLGIPGITAHRTVHVAGSVEGRTVLVQGVLVLWELALFNSRIARERE